MGSAIPCFYMEIKPHVIEEVPFPKLLFILRFAFRFLKFSRKRRHFLEKMIPIDSSSFNF